MNKNSMNKVILVGRLGKDPEQLATATGTMISKFSIATTSTRKQQTGEYLDETEWHNCVAFGKTAEFINRYFTKGRLVYLEGRLKTSNWEKDGVKHYKTDVLVDIAMSLERSDVTSDSGKVNPSAPSPASAPQIGNPHGKSPIPENEEELPF